MLVSFTIEDEMSLSDIELALELNGVDKKDIASIIELCKGKGVAYELIDDELERLGYAKVFTVEQDDYDEYDEWADDEYSSVEKFPYKQDWMD
jgi:hypothetical protein